jgi:ribosomal-protein-alanine N-acetyltransferase
VAGISERLERREVRLETARLVLRTWRESDAEALVRHAGNRNVSLHLRDRFPYPYTLKDAREFLATDAVLADPPLNLAIEAIENPGEAIGSIGLMPMTDIFRFTCEVGYWIAEACWGRGYAAEALVRFTDYTFEKFPYERLEAHVSSGNPSSCRVLEKAGYIHEATLRRNVYKHGEFYDSFVYSRLRVR